MHSFLDDLLVGVALLASVIYAVFSLGPRTLRGRLLVAASALLRRLPRALRLHGVALRLDAAAMRKTKGACGGCDDCGSEQSPTAQRSGSDVRISVSEIGRR
jgi:hypothetical protein